MTDMNDISTNDLEAELAKRRSEAAPGSCPPPKPVSEIDWSGVHRTVVNGIKQRDEDDNEDDDLRAYIYEAAVEAVYGKAFWDWSRKRFG